MKRVAEHGKNVHGMKDQDFTPEFMEKVGGLIRTSLNSFLFVCSKGLMASR